MKRKIISKDLSDKSTIIVNAWEKCSNLMNQYYDSLKVIFINWIAEIHDKVSNDDQRWSEFFKTTLI